MLADRFDSRQLYRSVSSLSAVLARSVLLREDTPAEVRHRLQVTSTGLEEVIDVLEKTDCCPNWT